MKCEYDYKKLRGRIIEKYGSNKEFAEAINKKPCAISHLLNGTLRFTQEVIDEWCKALDIVQDDIGIYFFSPKVAE